MPRRISKQLDDAQVFIENVLGIPELQTLFAEAGRDAAYFAAGRARYKRARNLHRQKQIASGHQYGALQALRAARSEAEKTYLRHVRLARIAFKGDARAAETLQLRGGRQRSLAGWLDQATLFYENLLADAHLQAAMASFGVGRKELHQAKASVEAVMRAARAQKKEKGQAQQATQDRNAALAELAAWLSENTALARVLLADQPQRLEQLGLLVRS